MSVDRRPIANRHQVRHRRRQPAAGRSCGCPDPRARRQRGRRRHRDQCSDGTGRAAVERHWRRSVRHRLRGENRHASRAELRRLGAGRAEPGAAEGGRHQRDAAGWHSFGHGSRRGRGMGRAPHASWPAVDGGSCWRRRFFTPTRVFRCRTSSPAHWEALSARLATEPNAAATYLPGGRAPRGGELFRNPDLAASLRRIARDGFAGFYDGPTADAILAISRERGGTMIAVTI